MAAIDQHPAVLVIAGPTASGKSALGILLADKLGGEIISADSRQLYQGLTIGTAKPSSEELKKVRHYFIDTYPLSHHCNAGEFGKEASDVVNLITQKNKIPIIVGGSGLYIQAFIDGLFEGPPANPEVREELMTRIKMEGSEALLQELIEVDPAIAGTMNPKTIHRIVRALEVYRTTGIALSRHHELQKREEKYRTHMVGLEWERPVLYQRINDRVDRMLRDGLIDEVKSIRANGFTPANCNPLRTVGYQEVFDFLDNVISETEMIRLIKRNTRRYAKRQLTWFHADSRIHWHHIAHESEIANIAERVQTEFQGFLDGFR